MTFYKYNYSLKLIGIILLTTGLILNLIFIRFPLWTKLFFLLIMIVGGYLYYINRREEGNPNHLFYWLKENIGLFRINIRLVVRALFYSFIFIFLLYVLGVWIGSEYFNKRNTTIKGEEISSALKKYYDENKSYPANLNIIVGNNPMKKNWTQDSWGNTFVYSLTKGGKGFILTSPGKDQKINTKDDLIFKEDN